MSDSLRQQFVRTFLDLEQVDANLFRGSQLIAAIPDNPRVYGGQVIGQAMVAAMKTVSQDFVPHSLHCYFIAGADRNIPIVYSVDRVRDGRSFSNRFVKAIQNGVHICTCDMSFHRGAADSIVHQRVMPDVPEPDTLRDIEELRSGNDFSNPLYRNCKGSTSLMSYLPVSFDVRPVDPKKFYLKEPSDPTYMCWLKIKETIGDDRRLNLCAAAFVSDCFMVPTALMPHIGGGFKLGMVVSLDHSIWFHRPDLLVDAWMLYETESSVAANSRALVHGRMWSQDKQLMLSTAQEVLVRGQMKPANEKPLVDIPSRG
uniref:Acyl-CoA thioesterase II domain-containing protein n=1 Tax=Trichuris muris TaxID=70415 RepID=A0A5S6QXU8_TRIMR